MDTIDYDRIAREAKETGQTIYAGKLFIDAYKDYLLKDGYYSVENPADERETSAPGTVVVVYDPAMGDEYRLAP